MFVKESGRKKTLGSAIDVSYHVLGDLAKQFQRRRILEIDQSETRILCGGHVC